MNRELMVPVACCLVAFAALLITLHGATGQESHPAAAKSAAVVPKGQQAALLTDPQAKELLTTLADKYVGPWRQAADSPTRKFSRAMPGPISPITTEIIMASSEYGQSESFLLATVDVKAGRSSKPYPCVVDRTTKQVWLSVDGRWLPDGEWLKTAPLP